MVMTVPVGDDDLCVPQEGIFGFTFVVLLLNSLVQSKTDIINQLS
jgi:hypothetical protein